MGNLDNVSKEELLEMIAKEKAKNEQLVDLVSKDNSKKVEEKPKKKGRPILLLFILLFVIFLALPSSNKSSNNSSVNLNKSSFVAEDYINSRYSNSDIQNRIWEKMPKHEQDKAVYFLSANKTIQYYAPFNILAR